MEHMKSHLADQSAYVGPVGSVTYLQCRRMTGIDPDPVCAIFATKAQTEAEAMVCRVLEDIAYRLDLLEQAKTAHEFAQMVVPAQRVGTVAQQMGLLEVAIAARHLAVAAEQADGVALHAIMARMEHGFDLAVTEVWQAAHAG